MWVARMARRSPSNAPLFVGTLFVWFIVLAVALTPLVIYATQNKPSFLGIFVLMYIGIVGTVAAVAWLVDWFAICVRLKDGYRGPALNKAKALISRRKHIDAKIAEWRVQRAAT